MQNISRSNLDLAKKSYKNATTQARGIFDEEEGWRPPLRSHYTAFGDMEFITIKVRVYNGITEHNFYAKFPAGCHKVKHVCSAIAEKEGLTKKEEQLFSLWVIGRDIELQLKPNQDVFEVMNNWNQRVLRYTHYQEAESIDHPINQHWFLYKREASLTVKKEILFMREAGQLLMFGQARWNYITARYLTTVKDAIDLAALQLQISTGDYSEEKYPLGSLDNEEKIACLVPVYLLPEMKLKEWEATILEKYKEYKGFSTIVSRQQFLSIVRKWPCYGGSFFPCCQEVPPSGLFEHRQQNWIICASPNGISIIDDEIHVKRYIKVMKWESIKWSSSADQFFIVEYAGTKKRQMELITPQARMIDNVCIRLKYRWAKETGNWNAVAEKEKK